jgi:hypothetical protein
MDNAKAEEHLLFLGERQIQLLVRLDKHPPVLIPNVRVGASPATTHHIVRVRMEDILVWVVAKVG